MNIGDSLERIRAEEERILLEESSIHGKQQALNEIQQQLDDNVDSGVWNEQRAAVQQAKIDSRQTHIDKRREVVSKDRESLNLRYQRFGKRSSDGPPLPGQPPTKKPRTEPIIQEDADASMDEETTEAEVKKKKRNPRFICM